MSDTDLKTMWLYQYSVTGPRLDDTAMFLMEAAWERSLARRVGLVPTAIVVSEDALEPKLADSKLPIHRMRIPKGCAAFVLG